MISVSAVKLGPEAEELVLKVLRWGQLAQGPKVAGLELEFARIDDVRHAVAVNNGTTASDVCYPKLTHDYKCYRGHPQVVVDPTPTATRPVSEVLGIPEHPLPSGSDSDEVFPAVRSVMRANR